MSYRRISWAFALALPVIGWGCADDRGIDSAASEGGAESATIATSTLTAGPAQKREGTIEGQVVDVSCYLAQGLSGDTHRQCAELCANQLGIPLNILVDDGTMYQLVDDDMPGHDQNPTVVQYAEQRVRVTGTIIEKGASRAVIVKDVALVEGTATPPPSRRRPIPSSAGPSTTRRRRTPAHRPTRARRKIPARRPTRARRRNPEAKENRRMSVRCMRAVAAGIAWAGVGAGMGRAPHGGNDPGPDLCPGGTSAPRPALAQRRGVLPCALAHGAARRDPDDGDAGVLGVRGDGDGGASWGISSTVRCWAPCTALRSRRPPVSAGRGRARFSPDADPNEFVPTWSIWILWR